MTMAPPSDDIAETLEIDDRSRSRRAAWRWAALLLLLLAAALAGWYLLLGPENGGAPRYLTAPVEQGDLAVTVTATGTLAPLNEVEISSELSGIIRTVLVDYNDTVAKGEALAELDTDKLEAEVAHARATLSAARARVMEAEATLDQATQDFKRYQQLLERSVASGQKFDEVKATRERAIATLQSAKADVAVAEADLALRSTDLEKACICSPIDGVVLARNAEPGQTVASTLQAPILFTVAEDLSVMELLVDVDEADVSLVAAGQPASFTVDAFPQRSFPATTTKVRYAPKTTEGVVTYVTELAVDNKDLLLRPGMTATAEISVKTVEGAVLVPNAALRFVPSEPAGEGESRGLLGSILPRPPSHAPTARAPDAGSSQQRTLWVLRDGALVAVPVTIGLSDGQRTEITAGDIEAGQEVVLEALGGGT